MGLRLAWQSYPQRKPYMRFLYVRPEVCPRVSMFPESGFLQIPPHDGHPCLRLYPSHHRADSGLSPVRNVRRRAHPKATRPPVFHSRADGLMCKTVYLLFILFRTCRCETFPPKREGTSTSSFSLFPDETDRFIFPAGNRYCRIPEGTCLTCWSDHRNQPAILHELHRSCPVCGRLRRSASLPD